MPSQEEYDIVIVGAGFAGLTLAHHLPDTLRVLVVDSKPAMQHAIESTGLITQATYDLLDGFTDVASHVPNRITHIGIIAPNFTDSFFSSTETPWIYSTDTPALVRHMAETVPGNVTIRINTTFSDIDRMEDGSIVVRCAGPEGECTTRARFLVGADGAYSTVAKACGLERNWRFLAGFERVFFGDIQLGPAPDASVYHFWFGEFSLGYGGWLSPTVIDGRKAFRLGLAKLKHDIQDWKRIQAFIDRLQEERFIRIEEEMKDLHFSSLIPLNGPLRSITNQHAMLLGDAAGFCGAFAADGIKGAIVSGKVAAQLIPRHLSGDASALHGYHDAMQQHRSLMTYYRKQVIYRFAWDLMRTDKTFTILYRLIKRQKEHFIAQFCDSKDKNKSLLRVILHWRNIDLLMVYALRLMMDAMRLTLSSLRKSGLRKSFASGTEWLRCLQCILPQRKTTYNQTSVSRG